MKALFSSLLILVGCVPQHQQKDYSEAFTLRDDTIVPTSDLHAMRDLSQKIYRNNCNEEKTLCAYFGPMDMPIYTVTDHLLSATKKIRIATYNMGIEEFSDIIIDRLNAGVKVEYMVDYKLSFHNRVWRRLKKAISSGRLTGAALNRLTFLRTPVWRGRNPQMHNKIILIDDETLLTGSANYSHNGLVGNFENILLVKNKETIKQYIHELDELKAHAKLACKYFTRDGVQCGKARTAEMKWDDSLWVPEIKEYLRTAQFGQRLIIDSESCKPWTNKNITTGVLDSYNQLAIKEIKNVSYFDESGTRQSVRVKPLAQCFKNVNIQVTAGRKKIGPHFARFLKEAVKIETFADGKPVHKVAKPWNYQATQPNNEIKAYFSPEDQVGKTVIGNLKSTCKSSTYEERTWKCLEAKKDAFVYGSLNMITYRKYKSILLELFRAGVRLRIMIDRERWENPMFRMSELEPILDKGIFVMRNEIIGSTGAAHSKFIIVGAPEENQFVTLTGSLNWSSSAIRYNDENYLVLRDKTIAQLYFREVMNELFIYRDEQDVDSRDFKEELSFAKKVFGESHVNKLVRDGGCYGDISVLACTHLIVSLDMTDVSFDLDRENLWVFFGNERKNGRTLYNDPRFSRLITHPNFVGRFVTAIPFTPGAELNFKFFKAPKGYNPMERGGSSPNLDYEYDMSVAGDRTVTGHPVAFGKIEKIYKWGSPF